MSPHQCTHCGEIYPDAAAELLAGCKCGSKFFYYIRQDKLDELNRINNQEIQDTLTELARADKVQIEKDIREITGMEEEPEKPVILDLESIRVLSPGKFEIDIVNLFSRRRPIIYKLEEGKYIIDLTSTYKTSQEEINKKIKNPQMDKEEMFIPKKVKTKESSSKDLKNLLAKKNAEKKDSIESSKEKIIEKKDSIESSSKDLINPLAKKNAEKKDSQKKEKTKEGEKKKESTSKDLINPLAKKNAEKKDSIESSKEKTIEKKDSEEKEEDKKEIKEEEEENSES